MTRSTAYKSPSSLTRTDASLPWTISANEKYFCMTCIFLCALSGESKSTNPFGKKKSSSAMNHNENDFIQRRGKQFFRNTRANFLARRRWSFFQFVSIWATGDDDTAFAWISEMRVWSPAR